MPFLVKLVALVLVSEAVGVALDTSFDVKKFRAGAEFHLVKKNGHYTMEQDIEAYQGSKKVKEKKFQADMAGAVLSTDVTHMTSPFDLEDKAEAVVKEAKLGDDITLLTTETVDGLTMTTPGSFRAQMANATLHELAPGSKERKLYYQEERVRNQWAKNKNGVLLKWLLNATKFRPNDIVVLIDNGNSLFGGCSEKEMMNYYRQTVQNSNGSQVVCAAEVSPWPIGLAPAYNRTQLPWLADNMRNVNRAFDIKDNWVENYADCGDMLGGPCDSPPTYRFLNYQFVMGPISEVKTMVKYIFKEGGWDQIQAHKYLLGTKAVTLDYSGNLAMSMHNLAEDKEAPVEVKKKMFGKPKLFNKVTQQTQCFVLGNGNSESYLHRLAKEMQKAGLK